MGLSPAEIVDCFRPYRPAGYTRETALATFSAHVVHAGFRSDLDALVTSMPSNYDVDAAAELVRSELLMLV